MEEGDLGAGKRTAAALGAWIVFEDETGQTLRPPRSRTWGRRGITPLIRVRGGGSGSVSVAGLACYRPGYRTRLLWRLHQYRGRKGERKAFTWQEYRDLLTAAHHQLHHELKIVNLTVRQDELVVMMEPREKRRLTLFGLRKSRSRFLDGQELRVPLAKVVGVRVSPANWELREQMDGRNSRRASQTKGAGLNRWKQLS